MKPDGKDIKLSENENAETANIFGIRCIHKRHTAARAATVIFLFGLFSLSIFFYIICDRSKLLESYIFSIGIAVAALGGTAVLCLICSMDMSPPDDSTPLFYILLTLTGFQLFSYVAGWVIEGNTIYITENYIINTAMFLITPIIIFTFWNYQKCIFAPNKNQNNKFTIFLAVFGIADILYIIIGAATGFVYYVDSSGYFRNNFGYIGTLIYPSFTLVCCFVENLRHDLPKRKRAPLIAFCLTPILTSIMSVFLENYTFIYVVVFGVLMLTYGVIQQDRSIEHVRQSRELTEKKTQIMLSQIQPHFLYNALNVISGLCEEDALAARDVVDSFAAYLRMNMESLSDSRLVSFEKELEHTQTYLSIEQHRFADDLNIVYDIDCTDFMLPPLTLQPIAENAVKHGICAKEYGGTVTISTRRENGKVYIAVTDDGAGFDVNERINDGKQHIGIENVRKRLSMLCGGKLKIESEKGKGTKAVITISEGENGNTGG